MENIDENNHECNVETINTAKKEEEKEQISKSWIINEWKDLKSTFHFSFNVFKDIFHFTAKNEDDGQFQLSAELEYPTQSSLFFITIIIHNKDNQNSLQESKTLSFSNEHPIQKINLPINYNQLTEENGFITPEGNLHLTIDITNLRKSHNQPLIIPIINPVQQQIQLQNNNNIPPPPYAGLKNQGSTCYMNSILQSLYHIPLFKSIIYSLDSTTKNDTSDDKNIPLNLQRLFGLMQLTHAPCSTIELTKSFGWDAQEIFRQHDAQEFCRQFLDNLEMKMKGTILEEAIPSLFKGKMVSGIRCRNVSFQSLKEEDFYDIQLDVSESSTLEESFQKIVENDPLVGDNQYDAGPEYGMQDADMTTAYVEFPRVLHLHLRRFNYDPSVNNYVKINKKYSFPEIIDLAPYMLNEEGSNESEDKHLYYELFGVLVHWGTIIGGHYFAYIRTTKEHKWYEFNDTKVTEVSPEIAIEGNFGGPNEPKVTADEGNCAENANTNTNNAVQEKLYSAYMLIYVQQDAIDDVFKEVEDSEVPDHVVSYMKQKEEEEKAYAIQLYEKENTINTPLVTDKVMEVFAQNNELKISVPYGYDEQTLYTPFEVKKYDTFGIVYEKCSKIVNKSIGSFILFPISREKISKALQITDSYQISSLNPLPTGFLIRMRGEQEQIPDENENSSIANENENEDLNDNEVEIIEQNGNKKEETNCNGNANADETSNLNQNENKDNEKFVDDDSENDDVINLSIEEEESNILFVFSYFRSIKRCPIHFVFTKEVHSQYTLSDLFDDFIIYFKLPSDCKLESFRAVSAYQIEKYANEDLITLVQQEIGQIIVIQPVEEFVDIPCCYTYNDMTLQSSYDEEEEDDEYVSYVNNYMKENPLYVSEYMAYHYRTAQISVQTKNGHKNLIVPYIISFKEFKMFVNESFALDYDDKYDSMLVFPYQNCANNSIFDSPDSNDESINITEMIRNISTNSSTPSNDQLSFKIFVIKDASIECFHEVSLFEISNSVNPSFDPIFQILPKTVTYNDALLCLQEMMNISNNLPLRLIAVSNRRAYWLNGPGQLLDVNFPIKVEIIPESQRNLDPTDVLLSVLQFKVACYSFMTEKGPFNQIDDGDPYLFKFIKDEKFIDTKSRLLDERRIPLEIHKNLHFFLLNPKTEEKEHLLVDDDVVNDLVQPGSSLYFGPTNTFNTAATYRVQKQSSVKIYN